MTIEEIKTKFGTIAIVEGSVRVSYNGMLGYFIDIYNCDLKIIEGVYYYPERLKIIMKEKIETLLIDTSFVYQDKIYDVAKTLIHHYNETGWKPKHLILASPYGLNDFYYLCEKLNIELYIYDDDCDFIKIQNIEVTENDSIFHDLV